MRIAQYLANKVFPALSKLSDGQRTSVIKQITEIAPYISGDDAKVLLKPAYEFLLAHAPLTNDTKTNFTFTEAGLSLFHHIGPKVGF